MPAFFDSALAQTMGSSGFIQEDKIDEALRQLIRRPHISKGQFNYPSQAELRDLTWNHMDQNHRPFIHRTYGDASRVHIGTHSGFSLTRFGRWPILIPVFDGYFKPNGFYQILVLFGLLVVVNIIECNPDGNRTRMNIRWTIASHRWLRFLHPLLHRRLIRLNDVQNREDDPIRHRRVALRAMGYRFKTDDPDFVNSNVIDNNTIYPAVAAAECIALTSLPQGQAIDVSIANRAFILRRDGPAVDVWPGVCPHEGAELKSEHLRGRTVTCPWHGLEYGPRHLAKGQSIAICGARLEHVGGTIQVSMAEHHGSAQAIGEHKIGSALGEKVEHVARALFEHNFKGWAPINGRPVTWNSATENTRQQYRLLAQSAIGADAAWDTAAASMNKLKRALDP
jgi:nitrite reductase/ring-hydroxylating ferredoxin subunit